MVGGRQRRWLAGGTKVDLGGGEGFFAEEEEKEAGSEKWGGFREDFLKVRAKQSQEVELLEIVAQKLKVKLSNAIIEACNSQHQMVMDSISESVPIEEEEINHKYREDSHDRGRNWAARSQLRTELRNIVAHLCIHRRDIECHIRTKSHNAGHDIRTECDNPGLKRDNFRSKEGVGVAELRLSKELCVAHLVKHQRRNKISPASHQAPRCRETTPYGGPHHIGLPPH
ncbi:hypothetical protein HAX54_053369 [Datura stramonium]|uniref:Uncharacterized protein n=1 Tax=Datura stramonium TaxID=4076 RepID=A0ABS8T0V2_DATST|nr:hypothetical protein [Datura stramonium]